MSRMKWGKLIAGLVVAGTAVAGITYMIKSKQYEEDSDHDFDDFDDDFMDDDLDEPQIAAREYVSLSTESKTQEGDDTFPTKPDQKDLEEETKSPTESKVEE